MAVKAVSRIRSVGHRALCVDEQGIQRMAAGHVQAVALRSAKSQVGATLGQVDVANGLTLGIEHPYPVQGFQVSAH